MSKKLYVLVLNIDIHCTNGSVVETIVGSSFDRSILEKKMKKLENSDEYKEIQEQIEEEGHAEVNGSVSSYGYSIDQVDFFE